MDKECGTNSPFSVKLSSLFDHFITSWELEQLTHVQGAVAALAQEGLEELCHIEGQEWWWKGDTPCPR